MCTYVRMGVDGRVNRPINQPTTHNKTQTPIKFKTYLQQRLPIPGGHRRAVRLADPAPRLEPLLHRHRRAPLVRLLLLGLLGLGRLWIWGVGVEGGVMR